MSTYWHRHLIGLVLQCEVVRCDSKKDEQLAEIHGFQKLSRRNMGAHLSVLNRLRQQLRSSLEHTSFKAVRTAPSYNIRYLLDRGAI